MRLVAAILGLCTILSAQDPKQIVARSIEADRGNVELARYYTCLERREERRLDSSGSVKSKESSTWDVTLLEGSPYRRLVARDDRPLSADDQRKEEEKLRKSIEDRKRETPQDRERRLADWERRRRRQREPLKEMLEAFDFRLAGEEAINGGEAYVIDAAPKKGYKPKLPSAAYFPKIKGRFWIDKTDYQWIKLEAETLDTISFAGFLLRLAKGSRLTLEQERVNREIWLPKRVVVEAAGRVLLVKSIRLWLELTYSQYRKFQVDSKVVTDPDRPR